MNDGIDARKEFLAFFLGGVAAILALKEMGRVISASADATGPGYPFIVTAVPCVLMLWYARRMRQSGDDPPRDTAAGDNLYYLGFLYTLTSLGHSLYLFSTLERLGNVTSIVNNFGIALATTILGMALRIVLTKTDRAADDLAELDHEARTGIADSARMLRAEMDYAIRDLGNFRKDVLDKLRRHTASLERLDLAVENLHRSVTTIEQQTGRAVDVITARTGQLDNRAQQSLASLSAVDDGLDRIRTASDRLESAAARQVTSLAEGADDVRAALQDQSTRIRDIDFQRTLDQSVRSAAADLRAVGEGIADNTRQAAVTITTASDELTRSVPQLRQMIKELAETVAAAAKLYWQTRTATRPWRWYAFWRPRTPTMPSIIADGSRAGASSARARSR